MKRFNALGLILILASCSGELAKGPFFWSAEKEGKSLNILGTIHLGVALEDLQCSSQIKTYLDNSAVIFTEIKKEEAGLDAIATESQAQIQPLVLSSTGREFKSLNEKSQQFFKDKFVQLIEKTSQTKLTEENKNEISNSLNQLSYFGLQQNLSAFCLSDNQDLFQKHKERMQELSKKGALDLQIQQLAQAKGKALYLESQQDRVEAFLGEDDLQKLREQAENLKVEDIESDIQTYDKSCSSKTVGAMFETSYDMMISLQSDYLSGKNINIEARIKDLVNNFPEEMPDSFKKQIKGGIIKAMKSNLLKFRNERWFPKLLSAHRDHKQVFVAAGLAHFTSAHNILDQLRDSGFSVKRMKAGCKF